MGVLLGAAGVVTQGELDAHHGLGQVIGRIVRHGLALDELPTKGEVSAAAEKGGSGPESEGGA